MMTSQHPLKRVSRIAFLAAMAALATALIIPLGAPAQAASWTVDPSKSKLAFSGTQTGSRFDGSFSRYTATIDFDPDRLETSRIAVTVDLASAATGDAQRDTALPEKDWFDVGEFPQARFESNTIRKTGDGSYEAAGTLTIRGISQPVVLPFTLQIDGANARAKGRVSLLRNAFGIGQGAWNNDQWVAFEVGVDIDIVAAKAN